MTPDELKAAAEQLVHQWDHHDRYRDFEGEGEPTSVAIARAYLAERAARERLVAEWRAKASKSDWQGADREAWAVHECASELAALDAPAVSSGPRIIGFGETSRHIEIQWGDERIEFQRGADGRWRNIGQPKREGA